jgi:hypothetical protein
MTTAKYSVGNIVAVIVCMLVAVGAALYAFFGNPTRGTPGVMGVFFTGCALLLGWIAFKAIRNRRR